jgi:hypothetical protein
MDVLSLIFTMCAPENCSEILRSVNMVQLIGRGEMKRVPFEFQ